MDSYSDPELEVYSVWLPMLPGDARGKWKASVINDSRATHFWNGNRKVGRWFSKNAEGCAPLGPVAWDAYFLFDREATWGDVLSQAVICGTPIVQQKEGLITAAPKVLKK